MGTKHQRRTPRKKYYVWTEKKFHNWRFLINIWRVMPWHDFFLLFFPLAMNWDKVGKWKENLALFTKSYYLVWGTLASKKENSICSYVNWIYILICWFLSLFSLCWNAIPGSLFKLFDRAHVSFLIDKFLDSNLWDGP